MSEVLSFGLTERELKGVILPNIDKIAETEGLITTVGNVPVLKPLQGTLEEVNKLLWSSCGIRIVSQGNLSKFLQGVLHDEETRKWSLSFCTLVKLDKPKSGLIPCLQKRYELLFVDTKRAQILGTKDAQVKLQHNISKFSFSHSRLSDYNWKQIILPFSEDSSHLAQSFIGAQVLNWAYRTYKTNHTWEQFLGHLQYLPILSSENAARFITYINNKPDLDEQERMEQEEKIKAIVDDGIEGFRNILSIREEIERYLNRKCSPIEVSYIRKRYISGCIESFQQESNQTLHSHFPKGHDDTARKFDALLHSLNKTFKFTGT